jgi:hypothetical protein
MPSIRGGDPGDLMAALDGYYLSSPYHWGGGVSIFDPKMVSSAQLSHGVFSTRYGHTISGLLEVSSKKPDPREMELDLGVSTSAANVNLSYPLGGKGGILVMGKVTYWDTLVLSAQGLSRAFPENETLDAINSVSTSPYIRSAALELNYRFTPSVEWTLNGFFGSDGVGASYKNDYTGRGEGIDGHMNMDFDYHNYQGFLISGLTLNPAPSMVIRSSVGLGFTELIAEGVIDDRITVNYNEKFLEKYALPLRFKGINLTTDDTYNAPDINAGVESDNTITNAQARVDWDWDLGHGFLAAAGAQELYTRWQQFEGVDIFMEQSILGLVMTNGGDVSPVADLALFGFDHGEILRPFDYKVDVTNQGFTSSAYTLLEYADSSQWFGGEIGIRMDHIYFLGKDFSVQTYPVWNPRLNLDFSILKNKGILDSLAATIGTGFFSSMSDNIAFIEGRNGLEDFDMTPNRSWTTVAGIKIDLSGGVSFNIEGYHKYVYNRAYIAPVLNLDSTEVNFVFNGDGRIWGFDLQLQKLESRYWDGWISYSFTYARYHEPKTSDLQFGGLGGALSGSDDTWYYPSFHRFHNFNLVLNIKPVREFNIALRFGFASGQPKNKVGEVEPYPVQLAEWDEASHKYIPVKWDEETEQFIPLPEGEEPMIIQKFRRDSWYDDNERTSWSFPLDLKFSFFLYDKRGKVQTEIYLAVENLLSLVYTAEGNTRFNDYTGVEDTGGNSASYELPIPMPSFGFKWSF